MKHLPLYLFAAVMVFVIFFAGDEPNKKNVDLYKSHAGQLAIDAAKMYEIAARNNDLSQMYQQADICQTTYLHSGNESQYKTWLSKRDSIGAAMRIK